jgi:hypothetical protein
MNAPLLIVTGLVVLVAGSGLAILNNACKNSHHGWCAPREDETQLSNRASGTLPPISLRWWTSCASPIRLAVDPPLAARSGQPIRYIPK